MTSSPPPLDYRTPYVSPTSDWQRLIGILSIVFGAFICLINLGGLFRALTQNLLLKNMAMKATGVAMPVIPLPIDPYAIQMASISAIFSIITGFILILAGILTLIRLPSVRRWYFVWIALQTLGTALELYSKYLLINATIASYQALGGVALSPLLAIGKASLMTYLIPALIGMAYPIFLIYYLNKKSIRYGSGNF